MIEFLGGYHWLTGKGQMGEICVELFIRSTSTRTWIIDRIPKTLVSDFTWKEIWCLDSSSTKAAAAEMVESASPWAIFDHLNNFLSVMIKNHCFQIFLGKKLKFWTSLAWIALYPQLPRWWCGCFGAKVRSQGAAGRSWLLRERYTEQVHRFGAIGDWNRGKILTEPMWGDRQRKSSVCIKV